MDWCHHLVPTSVGMGLPLALGICWRLCNFISQVALQHTTAHTVYENNLISYHQNTTLVLQIQYTPTIRTKSDTFNQQAKTTIQRGLWLVSMIKLPFQQSHTKPLFLQDWCEEGLCLKFCTKSVIEIKHLLSRIKRCISISYNSSFSTLLTIESLLWKLLFASRTKIPCGKKLKLHLKLFLTSGLLIFTYMISYFLTV